MSKIIDPEYDRGFKDGKAEGIASGRKDMLDFLDEKYMNPKMQRGSAEGKAILMIAREAAAHIRRLANP